MTKPSESAIAALLCPNCGHERWILSALHNDAPEPLMATADLARYLNVPVNWIHHNMRHLPTSYRVGRSHRWRRQDVDTWLARCH